MHDKVKYINNRNEVVEFGSKELFIIDTDLLNYAWSYDTDFNRIENFRREVQQRSLTISIFGRTKEEADNRKNTIFEVFEKDVLANIPGKLCIGDYYLTCYIVESTISNYHKNYLAKEIKIVTDTPVWIKETMYHFYIQNVTSESFYPYDYPYDYSNNLTIKHITNNHITDVDFKLIIYGPVVNPTVYIKGHPYTINTNLLEGEYLTINSVDKTVIKTKINGEKVNEFNRRSKIYSVFKKIEPGQNSVSWNEEFNFDIVLFEERSEPKWI